MSTPDTPDLTAELDAAEAIVMGGATVKTGPIRISIAAQLDPIWRIGRAGEAGITDVRLFAEQMTAYVAENLERFADARGGDVFVAVAVDRGDDRAAHEYRSGRYVKEDAESSGCPPRRGRMNRDH